MLSFSMRSAIRSTPERAKQVGEIAGMDVALRAGCGIEQKLGRNLKETE